MHLGIAATLGLWSFSALMVVFTTSAFLISPEPKAAPGAAWKGQPFPAEQAVELEVAKSTNQSVACVEQAP
jgi:hypothetical protein